MDSPAVPAGSEVPYFGSRSFSLDSEIIVKSPVK
jgi:hypothetical protein